MKAIILAPPDGGAFHLGESGLDDTSELIHSDTLFSALANVYAMAYGGAEQFIDACVSGRLRFSSCFPAIATQDRMLFFLPRPPILFSETARGKRAKNIQFLSFGIWKKLCATYNASTCDCSLDLTSYPVIGKSAFLAEELAFQGFAERVPNVWDIVDQPKVKVHTVEATDRLYHQTVLQALPVQCGDNILRGRFYCLVDHCLEEQEWIEFLSAVRILADEGIGGQRSSGCGQFTSVDVRDIDLLDNVVTEHRMGLSLLAPEDNDAFSSGVKCYDTIIRGGGSLGKRGNAEHHRKQVRLIKEGSILVRPVYGRIVDISPELDGSILRNGLNFSIPIGVPQ